MNKIKDFTDAERTAYSQAYIDLIMNIEEIETFLSQEEVNKRFFKRKVHLIKDYLEKLDEADRLADGKGPLDFLKSDEQYKKDALKFKSGIIDDLNKLKLCHTCKCGACVNECKFKSCHYCSYHSKVVGCDKERYYVTTGMAPITLYSNDEQRDVHFEVVGLLTDDFSNKHYIYLVERNNKENQHILEYCKYTNGSVDYLSIDEELLDKVYDIFVGFDCYE
ncbi:MAG: hypothetical protein ACLSH8_09245 [Zhenhengia sp.]|jgi:hypothetical protein|uniref:hypothetical protein n=1 Tax=Zhenhengia sp. TaxID=2944208 RepID=UPI002911DB8B|nr:hypothetical protein [Clostridiales bacterium]MDU6975544.1 hypothetical protein [Clostridiales bacterium]